MTRRLWMVASLLAAAAAAWLYLSFGPDNLLWAWSRLMAPAAALPPAVPATRIADALLVGVAIVYLVGFVPLSIATWMQGAHLTSLARAAAASADSGADELSAARLAMLRSEAERASPWQLLLQFDLVGIGDDAGGPPQRRASIERAAIISDLVAHQSAASLFRGLALICLCLGLFAVVAQTISNMLGTDLLQRPAGGLELAATRGLLSAVTAVIVAGSIDLVSRLANAAIRQRAETLGRRFDRLSRSHHRFEDWDREPILSAEPIPPLAVGRAADIDDIADRTAAMLERSQRQITDRIDGTLQALVGNSIRPMLHEVSRVLSVLSTQAGNMVDAVDRRLGEQRDDARQIAEIAASTRDEIAKQTAVMLERSHRQLAGSIDDALHSLADTAIRPMLQEVSGLLSALSSQAESIARTLDRRLVEQRDDTRQIAEAVNATREELARQTAILLERSRQQIAETAGDDPATTAGAIQPLLQEVAGLLTALNSQAEAVAGTLDRRLAEQRDDARQIAEAANVTREELARQTAVLLERSQQQIAERVDGALQSLGGGTVRPVLQEVSRLLEVLSSQAAALVGALDRGLAEQRDDGRQFAEAAAVGSRQIAALLGELHQATDRSASALEQRLDRLIASQETLQKAIQSAPAASRAPVAAAAGVPLPAGSPPISLTAPSDLPEHDALALLSRFLSESRPDGTPFAAAAPGQNGRFVPDAALADSAATNDWAKRVAELRRSTADLTRDLPMLRPDGSK